MWTSEFVTRAWAVTALIFSCGLAAAEESEPGPDIMVLAEANNPKPDALPTIRVVKEKLWGKYFPMVSVTFPNVPDFQCDAWCYEAAVDFLDAQAIDGGAVEMRHRDQTNPQELVITKMTPSPGGVIFEARVELDKAEHPDKTLPGSPPGLNLCWQLRHAPSFASGPDPYPEFVRRCFISTEKGRTFLLDTDRHRIPVQPPDHEYNSPPWVQMYVASSVPVPETPPASWAGYSADRFITPVIGTVSRDGKYLAAIANDTSLSMSQAWHDCLHNNPIWQPADAPIEQQRWRLGIYALENDPTPLHEHVAADFPKLAAATVQSSEPPAGWKQVQVGGGVLEIAGSAEWLTDLPLGPFVRLGDGTILGVEETQVLLSRDEGKTWEKRPLAAEGQDLKVATERALLRTAQGAIILVFLNMADFEWKWNAEKSLPEPQTRLDVWAVRSVDEGKTWIDAQCIYDGYSGDVHHMIQARSGHIIVPVQELMYEDGRHALRPRFSVDEGHTWQRSNFLDIGGRGHHDGLIEATLAELRDGRIWMLCRTNLGRFWNAWSDNNGEDFRILEPSDIPATSSPGTFLRLASGRLLLAWNRPVRGDGGEAPENVFQGGDNQWSDVRVNNFRAELSVALSEDDGATWTTPVVVARRADEPRASLAYTYLFEVQPGQIWLTTMQGDVRISFHEKDVLQ